VQKKAFFVYNTASYLLRFRKELIDALRDEGYQPYAIVPRSDRACEDLERLGIKCIDLPIADQGITPVRDMLMLVYLWRLYVRERPSLVFNFTIKPVIYSSIASTLAGVRDIYSMIPGLGYVFMGDSWKKRLIRRVAMLQYRISLKVNRGVFFQNPDDQEFFHQNGIISKARSRVVNGSGVDLSMFPQKTEYQPAPVFLLIARLIWDKGIGEYVEAARIVRGLHPDAQFWLVGGRDSNPRAIGVAEVHAWERAGTIRYFGETADVRPFLSRASVFVLPSYREGTPRTVLEAMAVGLPIVTTDVPGCRETVVDGVNGFLVPARDARCLAEAMCKFVTAPGLIERMGRASRALATQRYDVANVTQSIVSRILETRRQ